MLHRRWLADGDKKCIFDKNKNACFKHAFSVLSLINGHLCHVLIVTATTIGVDDEFVHNLNDAVGFAVINFEIFNDASSEGNDVEVGTRRTGIHHHGFAEEIADKTAYCEKQSDDASPFLLHKTGNRTHEEKDSSKEKSSRFDIARADITNGGHGDDFGRSAKDGAGGKFDAIFIDVK